MSGLLNQTAYLGRKLLKAPTFTIVSVVTLALGIGATTAIFSVVHGVLLKPLPFDEPDRLVGVWHEAPGLGFESLNQSPALHFTYRDHSRVFDDVGMWDNTSVTVIGTAEPERLQAIRVTDGTMSLLRVRPILGRIFTAEDDATGAPKTVMLSHSYWQRRFGGAPDVIGETLNTNGDPHEVIGVLPEGFRFLRFNPDLYLPFQFDRSEQFIGNFSFQGIARLRPGSTLEEANADVARLIPLAAEEFPFPPGMSMGMFESAQFGPQVRPLMQDVVGDVGKTLWVLLGTVGMVLLIACANVANLFMVRAEGRQRELALRSALGADRGRVAKELLGESLALGLLGGVAGLAIAYGAIRTLIAIAPGTLPRLEAISIDPTVLSFTVVTSLAAGLFFGVFPVFKYTRPRLVDSLKDGGRGASAGKERQHARATLVVSQVALALVLLVSSGLMIRSFQALRDVHPGFVNPSEVLKFRVSIPEARVEDPEAVPFAHERIMRRVEQIPGIVSVGLSTSVTMDGWDSNDALFVEEFPMEGDQLPPIRRFKWIAPGYHETMGNPLRAGRAMHWDDIRNKASIALVTENLALEYWSSAEEAVGKRVRVSPQGEWREIVGVVGNVHDNGVDQEATTVVFWPISANNLWEELGTFAHRNAAYVVRSPRVGDVSLLPEIREAVWSLSPSSPVANVATVEELLEDSMSRTSFTVILLVIASGVALLIGAVGLYGVISYGVSQRTQEVGVRMALGARAADVRGLFLKQAALVATIGIVVGVVAALGLSRWMSALLFEVSPADPLTYVAVSLALMIVAAVAAYVPARRASKLDPTRALRWE